MIKRALIDQMKRNHDASHPCDKRIGHLLAAAALVCVFGIAAPVAAQGSVEPAADAYTLTTKRVMASTAAVTGLIGAVIGGLAVARSAGRTGTRNGRRGALVALCSGRSPWSSAGSS